MGIIALLPGGFKPPHGKHYQLAKNYADRADIDKVVVIIGPKERDGVSREDSVKVWNILKKNDPKIEIFQTDSNNPLQSAFAYVENKRKGTYTLVAGSKDDDLRRSYDFYNAFSKEVYDKKSKINNPNNPPSKYYINGVDAIIMPNNVLKGLLKPIYYKNRKDGNTDEISATVLRNDILNNDYDSFKTNYPNIKDENDIKSIFAILKGKVVPEKQKTKKNKTTKENIADIIYENAINRLVLITLLKEGGNIFSTPKGESATKRIEKSEVIPTVKWLEKLTNLPLQGNLLGSTGKKETSGDLDISVDQDKVSKEELISRLERAGYKAQQKKTKDNPNPSKDYDISKTGISVHFKTPILGDPVNGYVQTDFMFGNPEWMKFANHAPENSKYKGVHRAMLMMSIASAKGYKFSPTNGLFKGEDKENGIKDPDKIAHILLGTGNTQKDLDSVESIITAIKGQKDYEDLVKNAKTGGKYEFDKYNATFPEEKTDIVKEVLQRLISFHLLTEGAESRIQHPEDLIYWKGAEGAKEAIDLLQTAAKQPETVAQKWDGSPAVIFGIDEKGAFFFSDKHAYEPEDPIDSVEKMQNLYDKRIKKAKSTGKLNTPEQLEKYNSMVSSMKDSFQIFKNAWPKGLKGVFSGDLMYTSKPKIENDNYVFKPNVVKYEVPINSEIGKNVGNSEVGVILHSYTSPEGKKIAQLDNISQFKFNKPGGANKLMVFSPGKSTEPIEIDNTLLQKAKSSVSNLSNVDDFLNKEKLKQKGLSNLPDLLYAFTNASGDNLESKLNIKNFEAWILKAPSGLSSKKIENIITYISEESNRKALEDIFGAVISISNLKNSIIEKLDGLGFALPASINGKPGGEGYVITSNKGQVKLVNRGGFTAANRAIQR